MKNLMKNTITVLVLAVTMSTGLYAQDNKTMSKMMEDDQKKEQVYTAIMQDPELKKRDDATYDEGCQKRFDFL